MKIYLGTDHAGFELKEELKKYLGELGHEVEDIGAFEKNNDDDYPDFIRPVAEAVIEDQGSFGIILGASGQGEAMCANRVKGVRAGIYYGPSGKNQIDISGHTIDMIGSLRKHNNANVLSLGARFLTVDEAKEAVRIFIQTKFSGASRHLRRIKKIDEKQI